PPGGPRHDLRQAAGADVADRAVVERALRLDEPECDVGLDIVSDRGVVDVLGEVAADVVARHRALDRVLPELRCLLLGPAFADGLVQPARERPACRGHPFGRLGRRRERAGRLTLAPGDRCGRARDGQPDDRFTVAPHDLARPGPAPAPEFAVAYPVQAFAPLTASVDFRVAAPIDFRLATSFGPAGVVRPPPNVTAWGPSGVVAVRLAAEVGPGVAIAGSAVHRGPPPDTRVRARGLPVEAERCSIRALAPPRPARARAQSSVQRIEAMLPRIPASPASLVKKSVPSSRMATASPW